MSHEIEISTLPGEAATTHGKSLTVMSLWRVMRPQQWSKNLFILAPLVFGKRATDIDALVNASIALVAFCVLASALYIINDSIDAENDRLHPKKRNRPISSGELPVRVALILAVVLALTAFFLAWMVSPALVAVAFVYMILMLGYSVIVKHFPILDCMAIAAGFVLRVVGGSVAVGVMPTHWLIVCAFLLALFLAFTKRRQELLTLNGSAAHHRKVLHEYSIKYLDQVNMILTAAVIVCYALYTIAPETTERFGTNKLIYGTVFVAYGVLRYLLIIDKPNRRDNPTEILLTDAPIILAVLGWCLYNIAVVYHSALQSLASGFLQGSSTYK